MSIVRINPVRDLLSMEREVSRMLKGLNNVFGPTRPADSDEYENAVWAPLTDIIEEKDRYVLHMDLPGVAAQDVKISVIDGRLSITGERRGHEESSERNLHRVERVYGKFHRSFTLPAKVVADAIGAEYKEGQLLITIPKAEEVKPKHIEVKIA
jgi:HSP20 family protein